MNIFLNRRIAGIWWFAAVILGGSWGLSTWGNFQSFQDYENQTDPEVIERYIDRELLLLEAGRDENAIIQWWTGQGEREETLDELEALLDKQTGWHDSDDWFWMRQAIALARDEKSGHGNLVGDPSSWKEIFFGSQISGHLAACYLSEVPDEAIRDRYEEMQRDLLFRSIVMLGIEVLALLVGTVFLIRLIRERSQFQEIRPARFPGRWAPGLLLSVFFLGNIIADFFYAAAARAMVHAPEFLYYPWIFIDFAWRAIPALVLMTFFFQRPRPLLRVFRLWDGPRWDLIACALLFILSGGWLSHFLFPTGDIDPGDFLVVTDPDSLDFFDDLLSGVIAAPIFEEVVFRGFLFLGLAKRIGTGWAALISTVLFAVVHIQYDIEGMLGVAFFGLICAWLAWRTKSIASGIVLHMIYNFLVTMNVYLIYQSELG